MACANCEHWHTSCDNGDVGMTLRTEEIRNEKVFTVTIAEATRRRDELRAIPRKKEKVSTMRIVETVTREDEVRVAPKKKEYRGLCTTCKNAPTCTYPRDPDRAVLQCEEFEGYEPIQRWATGGDISPRQVSAAKQEDSVKYKGLCVNCENREHCTFPKPESGVWRCEEYE